MDHLVQLRLASLHFFFKYHTQFISIDKLRKKDSDTINHFSRCKYNYPIIMEPSVKKLIFIFCLISITFFYGKISFILIYHKFLWVIVRNPRNKMIYKIRDVLWLYIINSWSQNYITLWFYSKTITYVPENSVT